MSGEGQQRYDYMISYAWADREWVEEHLRPRLERAGLSVHPHGHLPPGEPSSLELEALREAMEASRRVLLVLTPAYLARGWPESAALLAGLYGPQPDDWPVVALTLQLLRLPPELAARGAMDAYDPHLDVRLVAEVYGAPPADVEVESGAKELSSAEPSKPEQPAPRYANVNFVDPDTGAVCPAASPLDVRTAYHLRIDIGPLRAESAVTNAEEYPVPAHLLPETDEGHWLDVVVTSEQFTVPRQQSALFLPNSGPSWACGCQRNGEHRCTPEEREDFLLVPLTSTAEPGEASLRIGFYYENNLVQSQFLTARVGIELQAGQRGYWAVIDYSLTRALVDVGRLPARTLNIFANENADGSHRVILVGGESTDAGKDYISFRSLPPLILKKLLDAARKDLHDRHRVKRGRGWQNLYDQNNAKDKGSFVEDLIVLAKQGAGLYDVLFQRHEDREKLGRLLARQGTIQTGRPRNGGSALFFPWALIYEIPVDKRLPVNSGEWHICELVTNWTPGTPLVEPEATHCQYEAQHGRNTICPYGFWGFKHILEHQPSWPGKVPKSISLSDGKLDLLAAFHQDFGRSVGHIRDLEPQLSVTIQDRSRDEILNAMLTAGLEFVYFFCHGEWEEWPEGSELWEPYILVGAGERLTTDELRYWQDRFLRDGWEQTRPLVFINGCHTAEVAADVLDNFVNRFVDANASGVIGTEVTVHPDLASEAAGQFYSHFLEAGGNVGGAIRAMRCDFLAKGNVMGLAYTPYCSAELHLER